MVIQLFIGLILIATASLLITQGKRRKFWSIILLGFLCLISWFFIQGLSNDSTSGFIYQWLPYKQLKADFNISASLRVKNMLLPLIYLLAVVVFLNIISMREYYSLNISVLNMLGFTALILLVSSHDFFQMLFASAMLSIICYYLSDISSLRRKLFVYNFLAEMSGFIALAIVYSSVDSISLSRLQDYVTQGNHKDFVAFLLLFALGCKSGLFMLNQQYNSLKEISFNRLSGILALSVPFAGLIWLSKVNVLLSSNSFATHLVGGWCICTFLSSGWSALINNNLNGKIISLAQMVYAIMFFMVFEDAERLYTVVPIGLAVILLVSGMVYTLAAFSKSRNKKGVNWIGVLVSIYALTAVIDLGQCCSWNGYLRIGAVVYLIVLGIVISILSRDLISAIKGIEVFKLQQQIVYNVALITAASIICFFAKGLLVKDSCILIFTVLMVSLIPSGWFCRIGEMNIWNYQFADSFYNDVIVVPLKIFGRILWLAVDFIFVEKGVVNTASNYSGFLAEHLRIIQSGTWRSLILWLMVGIMVLAVYAGVYIYE